MTRYRLFRYWFVAFLLLMVLPSCAQTQQGAEAADEAAAIAEQPPLRHHDAPPAVIDTVRYHLPVDTRIALAGSYGELRPDHFHGGLDFKTDQTTGHPVYSFADGYVRRVAINAIGYGLVVYVEHPALGLTSVYAHLDTFGDRVWQKLRERQVRDRLNNADVTFGPDDIPVRGGEVIALSGNTGSSAGPHVHFELRNIPQDDDDVCYDPQMFFLRQLKDTQAPRIHNVYLYPQPGEGVACGSTARQMSPVTGICATKGGRGGSLSKPLTAWGRVGLGVKAYDYMDEQPNKYGLKELRLWLEQPATDGGTKPERRLIYHFRQDAFRFSETRYTNSLTDYAAWIGQRSMIMKSYIEPGNYLQQVDPDCGDGIVTIDEERPYRFTYELEDAHRNLTTLSFTIQGRRSEIPARRPTPKGAYRAHYDAPLRIDTAGCHFLAGKGVFYTDADFPLWLTDRATRTRVETHRRKNRKGRYVNVKTTVEEEVPCVSRVYNLGDSGLPLHRWCQLRIDVPEGTAKPEELYIASIDEDGAIRRSQYRAAEGDESACVVGEVRTCGRFALRRDSQGPEVAVIKAGWQRMQIAVSDADSGVRDYCVLIDGQFVPFDKDNRSRFFGQPCHYGIEQGRSHEVEIVAHDNCGHTTTRRFTLTF